MKTVSFTKMSDGTEEDYAFLAQHEAEFCAQLPARIMSALENLRSSFSGYKIDRLEHSLQTATRAKRSGADIDWIVSALVHDIGDDLAPLNHDSLAAAIIKPYVREECSWTVQHHGIFQYKYYADKVGLNPDAREI
ncbi:MAG: HD domain-containing protein [Maricaulaceae bacterium]